MRWIRTLIGTLAPLALAACAGGPDFEAMTDHPGHPDAASAPTTALPGTLGPVAAEGSDAAETAADAVLYTCPMHPEIVRSEPGTCPICGMNLVPKAVEVEADAVSEEDPHAHH
jgi:hypothetical protein